MIADLRSDTFTKPTEGMLDAMMSANVGDDVFGEDPTVNELEEKGANLFGMEAGLYCPSGTMTNQIAIRVHTKPQDEIICDFRSHIYQYEGGGIAANSGASVSLLEGDRGRINSDQVMEAINPNDVHKPISRLVGLENTMNRGGGCYYSLSEIKKIREVCDANNLVMHLDGARLYNALVETNEDPKEYGSQFDSISLCLSKGLGAPVGSLLMGSTDFIRRARRVRKVFGGGMRQAGFMAAAGIYALDNHVERLKEDHNHAKVIGEALGKTSFVQEIYPIDSNIIIFTLTEGENTGEILDRMRAKGILALPFGPNEIRMITHLDVTSEMVEMIVEEVPGL